MSSLVVDTHVIVWYLSGDARLSATGGSLLDAAGREGHPVYVPSICLVQLG